MKSMLLSYWEKCRALHKERARSYSTWRSAERDMESVFELTGRSLDRRACSKFLEEVQSVR